MIERITLWSDSCIPQNRNSVMMTALKHFMQNHPILKTIEQKFSEPGHSQIQEVDCVHSHIEKALNLSEIFSPVSLLRIVSKVRPKNMKVIQLQPDYFYNFQTASQCFRFANVPFTKVKHIKLEAGKFSFVSFKVSFANDFNVPIVVNNTRRKIKQTMPTICKLSKSTELTKDKIKDLRSMTKYMPVDDRTYYGVMLSKS